MKRLKRGIIIALTLFTGTFLQVNPAQADATSLETYTITYSLTGVSAENAPTEAIQGDNVSISFTADDGYTLPESVTISVDGIELSDGYTYTNGELTVNDVFGNMTITVTGISGTDEPSSESENTCDISYNLYQVSASKQDGTVRYGTEYAVKLTADNGYTLKPSGETVYVDGIIATDGYSYKNGLLSIDEIYGNTVIEAIAVKKASSDSSSKKSSTTANSSKNNNSSSLNSNSKSAQALADSGQSARNYSSASYVAPKTGQSYDKRFLGIIGLVFCTVGITLVMLSRNSKKKNTNIN